MGLEAMPRNVRIIQTFVSQKSKMSREFFFGISIVLVTSLVTIVLVNTYLVS